MTLGDAAEPLVHIQNFRMDFGDTTVIKDLSFDVRAGETFGFLGSNGSGNTTTLRRCWVFTSRRPGLCTLAGKLSNPATAHDSATCPRSGACIRRKPSWT
jgi:ABC-2 type transport system ATP-binding protein